MLLQYEPVMADTIQQFFIYTFTKSPINLLAVVGVSALKYSIFCLKKSQRDDILCIVACFDFFIVLNRKLKTLKSTVFNFKLKIAALFVKHCLFKL